MTEYTITINGHKSGLTASAVENLVKDQFPDAERIDVSKQ